jgi:hypothetical protein
MTLDKLTLGLVAPWPKGWSICRDLSYEIRVFVLRDKRSLLAAVREAFSWKSIPESFAIFHLVTLAHSESFDDAK